jgi:hypothetical protein
MPPSPGSKTKRRKKPGEASGCNTADPCHLGVVLVASSVVQSVLQVQGGPSLHSNGEGAVLRLCRPQSRLDVVTSVVASHQCCICRALAPLFSQSGPWYWPPDRSCC